MPRGTPPEILDATLELLEEMTAISSPSGDLEGLAAAADHYGAALRRRGLAVEVRSEADADGIAQPVLYARGPNAGASYLLLVGHLDTVLAAAPPRRRDDRLEATGAIDMKGGLAALVGALDLLERQGRQGADDLLLVVVPDEEVAGHLSRRVVEELGGDARGLWVLEPGQRRGEAETLVLARRGTFHWRLRVTGTGAHAGNAYWQGRSALEAAAEWCLAARALAAPGPGPTVNAGRLVAGDASFVDDLAGHAGLLGTPRQVNVVPDRAVVEGEARFLRGEDAERLPAEMAALAERIAGERGVAARFEHGSPIRPLEPGAASRRWAERAAAVARDRGWRLEAEEDRGGISFSNFLPRPADLPILDGLGPVGGGMHTRGEFVELASLDRRIGLLAELLAAAR